MFSATVNTTTGKTEWKVIEDEDIESNTSSELVRSQYGDMLHDTERNEAYFKGVQYAVDAVMRQNKEPIVLDIGTGTGLLVMMAAKCGAKKITACEVLEPMAKIASDIITQNGYSDVIKVVPLRSTELVVEKGGYMEEKANILVTEVFDTELIGEGVLPTLLHAHQHLLEPDAIVVPSAATVYVQLFHSPHLWTSHKLDPTNFPAGVVTVPESWQYCAGPPSLWDMHVEELDNDQITFLSEPQIAAKFTFMTPPVTTPQQCEVHVTHSGLCHGLVMWWELSLCPNVSLSTSPWKRTQWRDHWLQGVQLLPCAFYIQEGNQVFVQTHNDDYCLWFTVDKIKKLSKPDTVERPLCTCGAHLVWNRSRMSMLNDSCRNKLIYDLLSKQTLDCEAVLCVSDASLLPLLLTKLGVKKTFIMESTSSFSTRVMNEILKTNNVEQYITTISGSCENLSFLDTQGTKIDMIVGEPYFSSTLLPWHSLYFWYVRTYVNHLLKNQPKIIPYKAHLQAIAVKFKNLHKLRSEISVVEGFNLSAYQTLVQQDGSCDPEPQFLWEYPSISCSQLHKIFEFDFTQPLDLHTVIETNGNIPLLVSGANAVVFWMVYYLDKSHSISEGLTKDPVLGNKLCWDHRFKQAVKFLYEVADDTNQTLNYKGKFCTESGDLSINIYLT